MKAWHVGALALSAFLVGCEKESAKAMRQAEIVDSSNDEDAKCAAKQKVAEAFLREENRRDYGLYKSVADSFCMNLKLRRQNDASAY